MEQMRVQRSGIDHLTTLQSCTHQKITFQFRFEPKECPYTDFIQRDPK